MVRWWPGGTNDEPRWLVVVEVVVRWRPGGTNDEPRWLIIVEVVRWWPGGTNNEPRWLVVIVVGCVLVVVSGERWWLVVRW